MEGKIKNPLRQVDFIDLARILKIQDIEPFKTSYKVTFYASTYEHPITLERTPYPTPREKESVTETLDPRFVTLLREGIDNPDFLDTPHSGLGGATPNQVLQTLNPKFQNFMHGMDLEFESIAL